MTLPSPFIELLNSGGVHAESAIAASLDLPLDQAPQRIDAALRNGLPLEQRDTADGKLSYSLASGVQLLDANQIAQHLNPKLPLDSFDVLEHTESTNNYLLAQTTESGRTRICLAESQSAGRGRRGNTWLSAPYRNVMMSMSWSFAKWPSDLTSLGLAVSLAVVQQLNRRYDLALQIKWPNDLMVGDKKLAGILIDVAGDPAASCTVVVGLGVNIRQPDWSKRNDQSYQWQDLHGLGVTLDRNTLHAELINAMLEMFEEFELNGFESFVEPWNQLSCYSGRRIKVIASRQAEDLQGQMEGVDSAGALLLRDDQGKIHAISDSMASVRLL